MRNLIYLPVLLILTSVLFWRCSEGESSELTRIASMVSDSPKVALAALGELGDSALSEATPPFPRRTAITATFC